MLNQYKLAVICVLSALSNNVISAETEEISSDLSEQQSVAVTIYNGNLALVKDQRKVKLNTGLNNLALRDVSAQIRPETALLRSISHKDSFDTLEQKL